MTHSFVRRLDASGLDLRAWSGDEPRQEASASNDAAHAQQRLAEAQRQQQVELESQRERGYQAGMAEGKAKAEKYAQAELTTVKKRLEAEWAKAQEHLDEERVALQALAARLELVLVEAERAAEEAAVHAAYAALVRILGTREAEGGLMRDLCRQALSDAGGETHVLWVCELDHASLGDLTSAELRIDPALERGQVRLQSRLGHYDTGLDVRLEQIRQAFLAGLVLHRTKAQT
jgi:flagellar assembly protein FliH